MSRMTRFTYGVGGAEEGGGSAWGGEFWAVVNVMLAEKGCVLFTFGVVQKVRLKLCMAEQILL